VSANRTQSILHKMFKWGMQPGRKYVPSNPLAGLERRGGKEKKRDRVLSDDEIRTLWWGLDRDGMPAERHVCVAIRMILTTMVRPYQAAGAQICELADLGTDSALYDMPPGRVKKDRAVIVPLSDLACTIIDEAIQDKAQKVLFPSKFDETGSTSIARASISQALNRKKNGKKVNGTTEDRIGIREFLGMAHFTAHDLRRTAATIGRRSTARRQGAARPSSGRRNGCLRQIRYAAGKAAGRGYSSCRTSSDHWFRPLNSRLTSRLISCVFRCPAAEHTRLDEHSIESRHAQASNRRDETILAAPPRVHGHRNRQLSINCKFVL
jgi:hypothetical protein